VLYSNTKKKEKEKKILRTITSPLHNKGPDPKGKQIWGKKRESTSKGEIESTGRTGDTHRSSLVIDHQGNKGIKKQSKGLIFREAGK